MCVCIFEVVSSLFVWLIVAIILVVLFVFVLVCALSLCFDLMWSVCVLLFDCLLGIMVNSG